MGTSSISDPTAGVAPIGVKARLRRIGVVDVGSNSVRLVVFDGMARSPAYFFNEKVLCGLGAGLSETGLLNPEGRERALAALHRFTALARHMDLSGLVAVATAAVRDSRDGADFCAQVEEETGLQIQIASGAEEARLAAMGILLGWPHASGLVSDMGGSSMELAALQDGEICGCETAPLGPLKLADLPDAGAREKFIRKHVKAIHRAVPGPSERLFLLGGSWRAVARLHMLRCKYPLTVVHGYEPDPAALRETLDWIPGQDVEALSSATGTSVARLSLVPSVAPVLAELIERVAPGRLVISAFGLREGLLYRQMPEQVRRLDPLIEACRHAEVHSARLPGFGDTLCDWLGGIYGDLPASEARLVRAACLLHDVNWRAHSDYRSEMCLASVTRANIAGIDHAERVFLGLALLHRYKVTAPDGFVARFTGILSEERAARAAILGRAMRLGAMVAGSVSGILEDTTLDLQGGELTLTLRGPAREVYGDAVTRRLNALASRLDARARVDLDP